MMYTCTHCARDAAIRDVLIAMSASPAFCLATVVHHAVEGRELVLRWPAEKGMLGRRHIRLYRRGGNARYGGTVVRVLRAQEQPRRSSRRNSRRWPWRLHARSRGKVTSRTCADYVNLHTRF